MKRARWIALGALAYPCGLIVGHWLFNRSVIYPHEATRLITQGVKP